MTRLKSQRQNKKKKRGKKERSKKEKKMKNTKKNVEDETKEMAEIHVRCAPSRVRYTVYTLHMHVASCMGDYILFLCKMNGTRTTKGTIQWNCVSPLEYSTKMVRTTTIAAVADSILGA